MPALSRAHARDERHALADLSDRGYLSCMLARVHWNELIADAQGRGGEWELTTEPGVRSVLVRRLPFSVRCIEGGVWVTHDADPGDHVLGSGQVFTASGSGLLVLWAFEPSRLLVLGRGWRMSALHRSSIDASPLSPSGT